MPLVLGLDAAWTSNGSSGVALVDTGDQPHKVLAIAPSYQSFMRLGDGEPVDWNRSCPGGLPSLRELVSVATKLASRPVSVIAVDMPLSREPIVGRRPADRAISSAYGARKCATHSPTKERPGPISEAIREEANSLRYCLATTIRQRPTQALLEVYPHPAILSLTGAPCRVPYKVQRTAKYWPNMTPTERRQTVAGQLTFILNHLKAVFAPFVLAVEENAPTPMLKRIEDAVDALVCCWVGSRWLDGAAVPYGDENSAIWVPHPAVGS